MTLSLTRRNVKGSPLTAAEYDSNLDKLETGVEGGASPAGFWIDASEFIPRTTAGCGINSQETATNRINRDLLAFDPGTVEHAQAWFIWPIGWATARVTFFWEANSGTGSAVFGAQMRIFNNGEAEDQAFGTARIVVQSASAANVIRKTDPTSAITPGGTVTAGELACLQIYRDAANPTDDLPVDTFVQMVLVEKAS